MTTRHGGHHLAGRRIIEVGHPGRRSTGVREEQRLVRIVCVEGGIAIEVVGGQVGEDADGWPKVWHVMQLEGRQLHRHPRRLGVAQRHGCQRSADIAGRHAVAPRRSHHMIEERGRGRLAIGSGDDNVRNAGQRLEAQLCLGHDLDACGAGRCHDRRVGRDAGRHHQRDAACDALEVVTADLHRDAVDRRGHRSPWSMRRMHRPAIPASASRRAAARPLRPSPATLTSAPGTPATAQSGSSQLERRQRDDRAEDPQYPEANHHGGLGPAELLEVMVQRSHPEYPV